MRKTGARWAISDKPLPEGLHKRHHLQGPIDDAFLDSFIFVRPTGAPLRAGHSQAGQLGEG